MATKWRSDEDKDKDKSERVNPTGTPDRGGMSEADKTLEKYRQGEKGMRSPAPLADKEFLSAREKAAEPTIVRAGPPPSDLDAQDDDNQGQLAQGAQQDLKQKGKTTQWQGGDISELPEAPLPTQGALRQLQEDSGAQPGPPSPRLQRLRRGLPGPLEGAIEEASLTTQGETVARDVAGRQPQANEQPTQDRQESRKSPVNYGLQLQRERKRKGWTQERLANMMRVPVSEVISWEKNLSSPDRLSRQKLTELLGKDIYRGSMERGKESSSASRVDGALQVRLTQEPLTAQNFTSIISALTELYTKAWLIEQGRFSDLINYAQTHDSRFTKEANLVIGKLAHNSPALIELLLSPPALAATATVALALKTGIDAIVQIPLRFKAAELENQQKELEMKIRGEEAQQTHQTATQKDQLELMQRKLEIEMQQLEVGKKRVEVALETASKMVDTLRPGIDKETKGMLVQALLPNLLQLDSAEGLHLALPAPQSS